MIKIPVPQDQEGNVVTVNWPPVFETIALARGDTIRAAYQRVVSDPDGIDAANGMLFFLDDSRRAELALIFDCRGVPHPAQVRFAILNAIADAMGQLLPPVVPVTFGVSKAAQPDAARYLKPCLPGDQLAAIYIDGQPVGACNQTIDDHPDPAWVIAAAAINIDQDRQGLSALVPEAPEVHAMLAAISRHILTWTDHFVDQGFDRTRAAFNVRLHERLTDPAAIIDPQGRLTMGDEGEFQDKPA